MRGASRAHREMVVVQRRRRERTCKHQTGSPQNRVLWGKGGATKRNLKAAHSSFDLSAVCDDVPRRRGRRASLCPAPPCPAALPMTVRLLLSVLSRSRSKRRSASHNQKNFFQSAATPNPFSTQKTGAAVPVFRIHFLYFSKLTSCCLVTSTMPKSLNFSAGLTGSASTQRLIMGSSWS